QTLSDALMNQLIGQRLAENTLVDRHDMEAVTRLHEFAQNARRPQPEQDLLELGHHIAATDLAEIAAMLAGRAVGELGCQRREALRLVQKLVERPLASLSHLRHI